MEFLENPKQKLIEPIFFNEKIPMKISFAVRRSTELIRSSLEVEPANSVIDSRSRRHCAPGMLTDINFSVLGIFRILRIFDCF